MSIDEVSRKRRAEGYQPSFDVELEYGAQGEALVTDIIEAIKTQSIEVKRDSLWHRYGRLFVERRCKKIAGWCDSGIKISEAPVWAYVLGDTDVAIFIPKGLLEEYCRHLYDQSYVARDGERKYPYRKEQPLGSHPTQGVVVPIGGYNPTNREWFGFLGWLAQRQRDLERGAA